MEAAARKSPPPLPATHPKPAQWRDALTLVIAHVRPWLVLAVVLALALTAWWEFRAVDFHALRSELRGLSPFWLVVACLLTLLNIAIMGAYDVIALGPLSAGPPALVRWRIGCVTFTISNLVATGPLAGPALRLWLYREHGVSVQRIAQCVAGTVVGLWGGLAVSIVSLSLLPAGWWGLAFLLAPALAVAAGVIIGRIRPPAWIEEWTGSEQRWSWLLLIGVLDWMLAIAVFLAVLQAGGLLHQGIGRVALSFLLGHVAGLLTLVPGGIGSADAFWLWSLGTRHTASALVAVIVAYRFLYYLIPWVAGILVLLTEWSAESLAALKFVRAMSAVAAAASGYVMILSAATPALAERLGFIARWLPMNVLEASHVASVLIGLSLVVLSRGLRRGFREAMILASVLLVAGALANLGKGGDWEEALILLFTCFLILRHHRAFTRAGRLWPLLDEGAVASAIAVTTLFILVGWWAHRDVPFAADLWTKIGPHASAARALRGAGLLLLGSSVIGLVAVMRSRLPAATDTEIDKAIEKILATEGAGSSALMVAAGDKLIWWFEDRGLVLYATTGNYLVAFSDPVVPPGAERDCLESFLEFAEGGGWDVVFYQVSTRWLPSLHDQGFALFKLGEEGTVDLRSFTMEGRRFKDLRNTLRRVERSGVTLRVLEPGQVVERLTELRAVSDAWLATKHVPEKRFSVGFFSAPFLRRFPAIVAESPEGRIVAFASLMPGRPGAEASLDLMRYRPDAPEGVMDAIFVRAFAWAREQGYARFSLGMAPLSTVGESSRAPLWERLARFLYRHGAYFYNFQGLRQYKEKFHPTWEPRYMGYKPPWEWPRAMGAVAALIAGGWPRMVLPSKLVRALSRMLPAALIATLVVATIAYGATAPQPTAAPRVKRELVLPKGVISRKIPLPAVGTATVYLPSDLTRVKRVVLFLSGDGSWNLGVVDMALRLAPSAVVAGISVPAYQGANAKTGKSCWYPAGQLETAAQTLEKAVGLAEYIRPTLVGYSSGASLVYAALAQAPPTSFAGGVSLGFCPNVEISRSICGRDSWRPTPGKLDGRVVQNLPVQTQPMAPWRVLHGAADQVCSPSEIQSFVSQVPSAHLDLIDKVGHGFSVASRWGTIFDRAVSVLPTGASVEQKSAANAAPAEPPFAELDSLGLPLQVVRAEADEKAVLIFLSGDGGWADLDQAVAEALAKRGITTVGWSTLRYFWRAKTPEEVLAAALSVAAALPRSKAIFFGGYSFGANVFGYLAPRLEKHAKGLVLIGVDKYATFEVSPLDWIRNDSSPSPYDVTRSLSATTLPWLCLESEGDAEESGCPSGKPPLQRKTVLPGGHHFHGDYDKLGALAAEWISEVASGRGGSANHVPRAHPPTAWRPMTLTKLSFFAAPKLSRPVRPSSAIGMERRDPWPERATPGRGG